MVEDDLKPKQLCYSCLSKLEMCYSFIESSIAADFKFDTIIQNSYTGSITSDKVLVMQVCVCCHKTSLNNFIIIIVCYGLIVEWR